MKRKSWWEDTHVKWLYDELVNHINIFASRMKLTRDEQIRIAGRAIGKLQILQAHVTLADRGRYQIHKIRGRLKEVK